MGKILAAALLVLLAGPATASECSPPHLMKVVARVVAPAPVPGSFAAMPKTIYRQGLDRIRMEEGLDTEQNIQLTIITKEPDSWLTEGVSRTVRHVIDPGPTFVASAPIFMSPGVPRAFWDLQFGCEAAFVSGASLKPAGTRVVNGSAGAVYRLKLNDQSLEIVLGAGGRPLETGYFISGRPQLVFVYDAYETNLPDDPALFASPKGYAELSEGPRP